MDILTELKAKAKPLGGRIVLPESDDTRTLQAADIVLSEGLADITLVGDPKEIKAREKILQLNLSRATIIDPVTFGEIGKFADFYYEKRKDKGITREQAGQTVLNELYFGALLVKFGYADGMIAGAVNTTADVLRAALQVVGVTEGVKTVSSCFIMVVLDYLLEDRVYLFADCAVVPDPDPEQLADIAVSTAFTRRAILGDEPKLALLSFSTRGSAQHEKVEKVQEAVKILAKRRVDFDFDGEMQLDAAIVPHIAKMKAPDSKVAGEANTLIFPDLQSGNIGYKLVQRFAKAEAIGPIIQGLDAPICDLSRGSSRDDIVHTCVLVLLMAQQARKKGK
ncbi:MAG: phosphate acetyltransferase [Candidatus Cloacimonetes bacterium]|nr:phosphate acetyltransferase [Candidatus Cloacimonadota bacterium]